MHGYAVWSGHRELFVLGISTEIAKVRDHLNSIIPSIPSSSTNIRTRPFQQLQTAFPSRGQLLEVLRNDLHITRRGVFSQLR
ncbi:hypothetical protein D9M72_648700 [compost metagenome]